MFLIVTGSNSNRTDVVFDVYRDVSLKNAEKFQARRCEIQKYITKFSGKILE